jgi:cytoskeletal protein RodZ
MEGLNRREGIVETLGSYLRKEREARNFSLEEISSAIKIRKGILSAIENDDYTLLPPPVFVKGFLRAYANHIGLDCGEVMKKYKEVAGRYAEEEEEVGQQKRERPFLKAFSIPLAAIGIVLLVIVYFISTRPSPSAKKEEAVSPPQSTAVSEKKSAETPAEPVSVPEKVKEQESPSVFSQKESGIAVAEGSEVKKLNLVFKAREETWVGFRSDDEKSSQILLRSGDSYVLRADKIIRLKIGNAGGVDLSFNGKTLPGQGTSGEVVRLTLTEEGVSKQANYEQLY